MKKTIALIALFFCFTLASAPDVLALAQISLQNNTSFWLNLYIDGNFGCGPVMPSGFCTSSVTPGNHVLDARKRGETSTVIASEAVNIGDGTSPTWTVTIEDPDQALIKRLNGARFVNRVASPMITVEDELVVNGTKLVWRKMVSNASPEVRKAILSGKGGFWHRTIGQWEEFARMQIVGREASYRRVASYGVEEHKFTINEEGNSITRNTIDSKYGNNSAIFHRE